MGEEDGEGGEGGRERTRRRKQKGPRPVGRRRERRERAVRDLLQETLLRRSVDLEEAGGGGNASSAGAAGGGGGKGGVGGTWGTATPTERTGRRATWIAAVTESVLRSLTVTVRNVHVRYEDPGNLPGFGAGRAGIMEAAAAPRRWEGEGERGRSRRRSAQDPAPSVLPLPSPSPSPTRRGQQQQHRPPFAVGIGLGSFLIESTGEPPPSGEGLFRLAGDGDGDGDGGGGSDVPHLPPGGSCTSSHKLATATGLSAYWDSGASLMTGVVRFRRRLRAGAAGAGIAGAGGAGRRRRRRPPPRWRRRRGGRTRRCSRRSGQGLPGRGFRGGAPAAAPGPGPDFVPRPHAYVLRPMSAALHLTMVRAAAGTSGGPSSSSSIPLPPSRVVLTVPSCQAVLARSTLEDVAYVRRSVAIWQRIGEGLLTEAAYVRLRELRPRRSPGDDPRAWWRYAAGAVGVIGGVAGGGVVWDPGGGRRRIQGWRGLVRAVRRRGEYAAAYRSFLTAGSDLEREECNARILGLEDNLTAQEIVAFRMHVPTVVGEIDCGQGWMIRRGAGRQAAEIDSTSSQERIKAYKELVDAMSEVVWLFDKDELSVEPLGPGSGATSPPLCSRLVLDWRQPSFALIWPSKLWMSTSARNRLGPSDPSSDWRARRSIRPGSFGMLPGRRKTSLPVSRQPI